MTITPQKDSRYWYSTWQFVLSLLAALALLGGAGLVFAFGVVSGLNTSELPPEVVQTQILSMFLLASVLGTSALLVVPSAYYAFRRILGKPVQASLRQPSCLRPTLLILALPLVILLGHWVTTKTSLSWLLLPPIQVLAIGLPVAWIIYLAARGLPLGSLQRRWGVFSSGLVLGPLIILSLETVALIAFVVVGMLYLFNQPGLIDQINSLMQQFSQGVVDPNKLLELASPWLTQPGVILSSLFFIAVLVPLIEEALKPIGVWLLIGFNLSPAAGFAAGALSGAGFALFESLALTSVGSDWAINVAARIGTAVIHILNTSLVGWALALAWREKRYLNLGLIYLLVVIFHGLWNTLAIINLLDQFYKQYGLSGPLTPLIRLGASAPYILGIITAGMFAALLWMNSRLRREAAQQPPATTESPALQADF